MVDDGQKREGRIGEEQTEQEDLIKLEFSEIAKSQERVLNLSPDVEREDVLVFRCGQYLLIYDEAGIKFTNERGELMPDGGVVGALEVNYPESHSYGKDRFFNTDTVQYYDPKTGQHSNLDVGSLAAPFIEHKIQLLKTPQNNGWVKLGNGPQRLLDNPKNVSIIAHGQLIALVDRRTGGIILYAAKDQDGYKLPRNWKRTDSSDLTYNLPDSLKTELTGEERCSWIQIDDEHQAAISDNGINIYGKNDEFRYTDKTPSIRSNFCLSAGTLYYCSSNNPREIVMLDIAQESPHLKERRLPLDPDTSFGSVESLQIDPSGEFFCLSSAGSTYFISRDTMAQTGVLEGMSRPSFDSQGHLQVFDNEGYLQVYETNLDQVKKIIETKKAAKLVEELDARALFDEEQGDKPVDASDRTHLQEIVNKYAMVVQDRVDNSTSLEAMVKVRQKLDKFQAELVGKGISKSDADYVIAEISKPLELKERELATSSSENLIQSLEGRLNAGSLTLNDISRLKTDLDQLKTLTPLLDAKTNDQIRLMEENFESRVTEVFKQENERIQGDLSKLVEGARSELSTFTTMGQYDSWVEFTYPKIVRQITTLLQNCPLEAVEARQNIQNCREKVERVKEEYESKFKLKYEEIRETAAEELDLRVRNFQKALDSFIELLQRRNFSDRVGAESYVRNSDNYKMLEEETGIIGSMSPDSGKIVTRSLKSAIANFFSDLERGSLNKIDETGAQTVSFGATTFPRWEARTKKLEKRRIEVSFEQNPATIGPGVKAEDICGDICIDIHDSHGRKIKTRLFEGTDREDDWRLGAVSVLDQKIPPSFLRQGEYSDVRKNLADWRRPDSKIKAELEEKFSVIRSRFEQRPRNDDGSPATGTQEHHKWLEDYKKLVDEYAKFRMERHVSILRRIDDIEKQPEQEYVNGSGYVPEWKGHWTLDSDALNNLEHMAKLLKMQSDTQQGILNLIGHAGTGKDVLAQMFCHMTNRPYFGIDCTRWTTESELSEDVVLEAVGGASQTVRLPSVVLNAITTPGAVMYFNEFNAMPEQAQIFLHSLMDEKRSLTLKTSSGIVIKAEPSVLLVGSMNPNYPGTYAPQFATKSRMTLLEVRYPTLTRDKEPNDPNPNPPYNSSEALRMARSVSSLEDLTYEPDVSRNEFVKLWDRYINGIDNGAPEPNATQRFDLDFILAIVNFGQKLREAFIQTYEQKGSPRRGSLKVVQPLTGREIQGCAYFLSEMSPEEKIKTDPEALARDLLEELYLSKIDASEERENIRLAMASWTSSKRVI